jgi:hypothetical protein
VIQCVAAHSNIIQEGPKIAKRKSQTRQPNPIQSNPTRILS